MNKNTEEIIEKLLTDKKFFNAFISEAFLKYFETGDMGEFLNALRCVCDACGGIGKISKACGVSRQTMHNIFTFKTSPSFETVFKILRAVGVGLSPVVSSSFKNKAD